MQKHWLTLNETYLFRFDKTEGIVVIGATNFPEVLDKYVFSAQIIT